MIKPMNLREQIDTLADSFVLEAEHKTIPDNYILIQLTTMKTKNHSYSENPIFP